MCLLQRPSAERMAHFHLNLSFVSPLILMFRCSILKVYTRDELLTEEKLILECEWEFKCPLLLADLEDTEERNEKYCQGICLVYIDTLVINFNTRQQYHY